jgi:hypothetical protein
MDEENKSLALLRGEPPAAVGSAGREQAAVRSAR